MFSSHPSVTLCTLLRLECEPGDWDEGIYTLSQSLSQEKEEMTGRKMTGMWN